jgi:threonine/homoserine/homoserine lactone efflux protein
VKRSISVAIILEKLNMSLELFVRGAVIGFCIAAPVGPIGLLCIRTTIKRGLVAGFCTGLGAAAADSIYGAIAAAGLSTVSTILVNSSSWLHLIGGGFLLYLGAKGIWSILKKQESAKLISEEATSSLSLVRMFLSTFLLTISNPMTIMSFLAIFAGLAPDRSTSFGESALMVAGVFGGSAVWWLILSTSIGSMKRALSSAVVKAIDIASSLMISGFGFIAMCTR